MTSFHGLPSDRTHAIAQTEFGVTWFATDGGLARYDGRRTNAINADGLPSGRVLALRTDASGALWIGTDNGAARSWNGKFDTVPETAGKVINAIITPRADRAIMVSEGGQIFDCEVKRSVGTTARPGEGTPGLSFSVRMIPSQPLQSSDKDHPGLLKLTSLAMVGEKLYVGTQSRGLLLIENGEAREITSKPRSYFVNALAGDSRGRLWVGGQGRSDDSALFDSGDPLKPVKAAAPTGTVTTIERGAGEDIWVGTDGHGAFHLQNGKQVEHFTFEGTGGALRSDHIFGLFVDPEEVVWFATDKGVCRYDPNSMRAENISGDASANFVRALVRSSRGRLFAGTNTGLYANDSGKNWTLIPEIGRRIIYALGEDKTGRVLVATANGLFASSSTSDSSFTRIPSPTDSDNVRAIANVGGVTYVATFGYGVEKLQGSQRTLVWPEGNPDTRLRELTSLGKDASDRLLIGTASAGVFVFDGKQTTSETALDKLKGDAVWSLLADGPDIWIASGKGLFVFQSGQLKEIVPGINARSLSNADNRQAKQVWCATVGNGLFKVALDDQFGAVVSRLDIEQGLPSQRVFAVWSENSAQGIEDVIAGTNHGVVRYQSGRVAPTVLPARVISQRIHQPSELSQRLRLDYPQNSLLLDVTAISSRTFPEQFQYAFALYDGSGKIIREKLAHDSQFAMEHLAPGNYKVVARAFTKDLTQAVPLSFEFAVARAPFPWTSTALAVLLTLALIALAWGYLQNRRIHRTSAELASANRDLANARLQLANETEAERRRIARDLHDQTLADLRNLALMVDQLPAGNGLSGRPNRAPSQPGALRSEIEAISQEVRRICEDLSPSALENVGLSAALQFALAHAVEHAAPDCRFEHEFVCDDNLDEKLNLPSSAQIQIYRIAQEALSNICRHAGASHVKMTANVSETNAFELIIEDDGRGFDGTDKKNPGRGVANIRARASMIDAEADWSKLSTGGTIFRLRRSMREVVG
ncbi:MAG TPA: two-component regulator propeller domain-containing protein [Pyrinomonadaceae bacterium]|nr:two-component regulator propeller domain-containing protein [Pyrinomonadaceae bacterium]